MLHDCTIVASDIVYHIASCAGFNLGIYKPYGGASIIFKVNDLRVDETHMWVGHPNETVGYDCRTRDIRDTHLKKKVENIYESDTLVDLNSASTIFSRRTNNQAIVSRLIHDYVDRICGYIANLVVPFEYLHNYKVTEPYQGPINPLPEFEARQLSVYAAVIGCQSPEPRTILDASRLLALRYMTTP